MSTALLSTAEASSITSPPVPTRRLPFALGGLLIGAAATAIVFVFANQHPGSPRTPVAHDESAIAASGPNTDAVEVAAPPQRHALRPTQPTQRTQPTIAPAKPPQPTNAPARIPQPAVAAGDLEAECRGYAGDRKWEALAHCADQLKPLDPKRAVELATRAAGEARSAPRIAGVESALHDKHLKQAKTELDQVWTESVEYARLKHAYEIQESQAIDDLAARLDRVKSASCEDYNQLLAKERPLNPLRVTAEAIRRIPCAAPPKCNADTLAEKALAQYNANQIAESLALYDAAYACRPALPLLQKAFVIACNLRDATKARSYWKRLPPALGTQALPTCAHNDITEAMLNAP